MKIEIDTTTKKVTVLEDCTIQDLIKFLKKRNMMDYSIEVKQPYYYYPWQPYYTEPYVITCEGQSGTITGLYNSATTDTTMIN